MRTLKTTLLYTFVFAIMAFVIASCGSTAEEKSQQPDQQSLQEPPPPPPFKAPAECDLTKLPTDDDGFVAIFDGTSTKGWRGYKETDIPERWSITEAGELFCEGSGRGEAHDKKGGDILFNKQFQNFHLKLEWKISEGGNSGIFYLGQEAPDLTHIWKTAPEMQVLDNEKHPDAQAGKDGNRQAGSLYDLIPAVPQNAKPAGEWNTAEVKVYKGSVWHIQNGETVLEYHLWTPEWNELVAGSKFPELNAEWAEVASKGFIGVQDHGDDVWYRNIKVKEL